MMDMLGFVLLCVCLLLFGLFSYFGFSIVRPTFGSLEKSETANNCNQNAAAKNEEELEDPPNTKYEVFLSFRGPDSRQGLAGVLYNYMRDRRIRVFRDNDELETGDKINKILTAIKNSEICVPIFSKDFAASFWCLREVEAMVEQKKKIMPVFYTATPDEVKLRKGKFKKDMRKYEKKHGKEQVKKWEDALKEVGKIKGAEVNTTGFAEFSKSFVGELLSKLEVKTKHVPVNFVERKDQEQEVMKLLDIGEGDVRLVAIHGMGGVGKTTLATVVFNKILARFDCHNFLENIQESLERHGPDYLLSKLLEELDDKWKSFLQRDKVSVLRENFRERKVLIVLDDVGKRKQIEDIVETLRCFGFGSRIIVTTRDMRVFTKDARAFEMGKMNRDEALQLFSRHAFKKDSPPSDYETLTNKVLSLTGRLPLALEVIGSLLHEKEKKRWESTIKKLEKAPDKDIKSKLKLSYDVLENREKQIFLDIACFFVGEKTASIIYMWEACDFIPDDGIEVLESMSLVKITSDKRFWMHDLIRDLGRGLVRDEFTDDCAKRSRIWSYKDASEVLKKKKRAKNLKVLDLTECYYLICTPDLSSNEALERLILRNCRALTKLQYCSIRKLKRLNHLDTFGCDSLQGSPEELAFLETLQPYSLERSGDDPHLQKPSRKFKTLPVERLQGLPIPQILNSVERLQGLPIPQILNSVGGLENLNQQIMLQFSGIKKLSDPIGESSSEVAGTDPCGNTSCNGKLLEATAALHNLKFYRSGIEQIRKLPSTLSVLTLKNFTETTRLPYFSDLMELERVSFSRCSLTNVNEVKSLGELRTLESMVLSSCIREMVGISLQLQNVRELSISSDESFGMPLLDFPSSISLERLYLTRFNLVVEIRGLEKLESLRSLMIWSSDSLVTVGNLSELKSLDSIDIRDCRRLREVKGLDKLSLQSTTIYRCESMIITDELKMRCRWGHFDELYVENIDVSGSDDE